MNKQFKDSIFDMLPEEAKSKTEVLIAQSLAEAAVDVLIAMRRFNTAIAQTMPEMFSCDDDDEETFWI